MEQVEVVREEEMPPLLYFSGIMTTLLVAPVLHEPWIPPRIVRLREARAILRIVPNT
jgi:hypothetical protein